MTTYRVKHDNAHHYVKLDKRFLHSPNLSAKAKGILAYLLSLPDDWKFNLAELVNVFSDGESSIRSGLEELKKAGYLNKTAVRDQRGQILDWRTDFYEVPQFFQEQSHKNEYPTVLKSTLDCFDSNESHNLIPDSEV